jgi:hypothetical protein
VQAGDILSKILKTAKPKATKRLDTPHRRLG